MGYIKDYYTPSKPCYGAYQPSSLCDTCWAAELCKEETLHKDGYFDEQAERAWWLDYVTEVESIEY